MSRFERDLHVLKYFSSVVTVSEGRVINVTEPTLRFCPLANHFFPAFKKIAPEDLNALTETIRGAIQSKIRDYGLFTAKRSFDFPRDAVPFGASEILASSLRTRFIDSAVVVCDGAGTVIVNSPEIVQGIGARMNTLIFTSPVRQVIDKLERAGVHIVFKDNAWIDPSRGTVKAQALGYKKIGVTVAGHEAERMEQIRDFEERNDVAVTLFAVCTTGISGRKIDLLRRHADLVWTCASGEIREQIGRTAKIQLSKQIPVFAVSDHGVALVNACSDHSLSVNTADPTRQFLVSSEPGGKLIRWGTSHLYVREMTLPVYARKIPTHHLPHAQGVPA
jgi:putative methanogenesis marker protein 8